MNNVVIVSATRTAVGKFEGSLINILAKYDHIVLLAAGKALKDVYSGKSYEEIVIPSSHIGLSVSREAHLNLWPKVSEWLGRAE